MVKKVPEFIREAWNSEIISQEELDAVCYEVEEQIKKEIKNDNTRTN